MNLLRWSLQELLKIEVDTSALDRLSWKDFGNGLSMSRLTREGDRELVLYRVEDAAEPKVFFKHEHIGGEFYLLLRGRIEDEYGKYEKGDIVFLDPGSVHTPRVFGETIVLVLWPSGVKILK